MAGNKQVKDLRSEEGYKFLQHSEADLSLHITICLHSIQMHLHSIQMHLHHVLGQTPGGGGEEVRGGGEEARREGAEQEVIDTPTNISQSEDSQCPWLHHALLQDEDHVKSGQYSGHEADILHKEPPIRNWRDTHLALSYSLSFSLSFGVPASKH